MSGSFHVFEQKQNSFFTCRQLNQVVNLEQIQIFLLDFFMHQIHSFVIF